jgi:peptide/nickel transport system substrate-binding protein
MGETQRTRRKIAAPAVVVGVLAICGWTAHSGLFNSDAAPSKGSADGRVRIYLHMRPIDLNPHTRGYAAESQVTDLLFDSLLERDASDLGQYHPALARQWETSPDHRQLTFHLRHGVRWHDGVPFTVEDVKFTFEFCRRETSPAPIRPALADVRACKVVDEDTVRFSLKRPSWRMFHLLAGRKFPILPRHRLRDLSPEKLSRFGRAPVGTGRYRFVGWQADSNSIRLGRNESHWDKSPFLREIVFKTYTDRAAAMADFKGGELDFMPRLRSDDLLGLIEGSGWTPERVRQALDRGNGAFYLPPEVNPRVRLGGFATTRVSFIAWNCRRPPLDEKAVRLALAHVLDRKTIQRESRAGLGRAVTGDQVWFGPAYDRALAPRAFDLKRARELLEAAGWFDRDGDGWLDRRGRKLSLEILYPSRADDAVLRHLAAAAKDVGIQIRLEGLERGRFTQAKMERAFDGLYLAWILDVEEDPYWVWHSSQAEDGANYSGFDRADELVEKARATADDEQRWALLKQLQAVIHEEQPVLFVQSATLLAAWQPRLLGVQFHPLRPPGWDVREWKIAEPFE